MKKRKKVKKPEIQRAFLFNEEKAHMGRVPTVTNGEPAITLNDFNETIADMITRLLIETLEKNK